MEHKKHEKQGKQIVRKLIFHHFSRRGTINWIRRDIRDRFHLRVSTFFVLKWLLLIIPQRNVHVDDEELAKYEHLTVENKV